MCSEPAAQSVACHQPCCLLLHVSPSRAEFPAICPSTSAHTSLPAVPTAWLWACPTCRWTVPKACEWDRSHRALPKAPELTGSRGCYLRSPPHPGSWGRTSPRAVFTPKNVQCLCSGRHVQGSKQEGEGLEGALATGQSHRHVHLLQGHLLSPPTSPLSPGPGPLCQEAQAKQGNPQDSSPSTRRSHLRSDHTPSRSSSGSPRGWSVGGRRVGWPHPAVGSNFAKWGGGPWEAYALCAASRRPQDSSHGRSRVTTAAARTDGRGTYGPEVRRTGGDCTLATRFQKWLFLRTRSVPP